MQLQSLQERFVKSYRGLGQLDTKF